MSTFEATFENWWADHLERFPAELKKLNPENFNNIYLGINFKALGGLTAKFIEPEGVFVHTPEPEELSTRVVLTDELNELRRSGELICLAPYDSDFVITKTSLLHEAAKKQKGTRSIARAQLALRRTPTFEHGSDELWIVRRKHLQTK